MHPWRKIHHKLRGYLKLECKAVEKRKEAAAAVAAAAAAVATSAATALPDIATSTTDVVMGVDAGADATDINAHGQPITKLSTRCQMISDVDPCTMPSITVRMPAQGNGYDCGVYVARYAKYLTDVTSPSPPQLPLHFIS